MPDEVLTTPSITQVNSKAQSFFLFLCFLTILFIYLTERAQEGEQQTEGEVEAGSPLSREPNAGLDPRILKSRPEPKADA